MQSDFDSAEIQRIESKTVVGHVRLASEGAVNMENTHPFISTRRKRHYAFAHNGTVRQVKHYSITVAPEGDTDSEHAFQLLLDRVSGVPSHEFALKLQATAKSIMDLGGNFNFLLSDGVRLYAHAHNSLWVVQRRGPYTGKVVQLRDAGVYAYLSQHKLHDEQAVLIATQPLTDEFWRQLPAGTVLVLENGTIVEELAPYLERLNSDSVEFH